MKFFIIFSCVFILSSTAFSQQIKKRNVELDDFVTLLGASGYELFSYDITEMLNERYDITIIKKEFETGKEIETTNLHVVSNKRLLTDFPESSWQEFLDSGDRIIDSETQAIAHAEKIKFGFYPSGNDTTKFIHINVPDFITMNLPFKLRGLNIKDSNKMYYHYNTRPFKINVFKEDEFIPLVLFGSSWVDERFNVFRFCGEKEIEPDMSSEILKDLPHYYVLGVKFVKKE